MGLDSMDFGFRDASQSEEKKEETVAENLGSGSYAMQAFGGVRSVKKGSEESPDKNSGESSYSSAELDNLQSFFKQSEPEKVKGEAVPLEFRDDSVLKEECKVDAKGVAPNYQHGYRAQEIEEVEKEPVKVEATKETKATQTAREEVREAKEVDSVITLMPSGALKYTADYVKFGAIKTKFEHGELVLAYDKKSQPLMYLLESDGVLMAYRYLQAGLNVRIPSEVEEMPVKYLHPQFFRGSLNPFSGVKFQALKNQMKAENLIKADKSSVKESLKGVKSLVLPNSLEMLPPNAFSHCMALKELVVPASVTVVSVDAFAGSCFSDLYFNGPCPKGFRMNTDLPKGVRVHFRAEYADTFGV